MVAWEVEDDLEPHARRARSVSDFCVKYEYLRCQRKQSDEEKVTQVTPLASPHPHNKDVSLDMQECQTPSPPAHCGRIGFGGEEFLDPATPPQFESADTSQQDIAAEAQASVEAWQANSFIPYYPGLAWPADQQMQLPPNMAYLPQPQAVAPTALVYYCFGILAPETSEQTVMPTPESGLGTSYDGSYVQEASSSQWRASDVRGSQSSQRRDVHAKSQPKVLEAGEVRRDVDSQGLAEALPTIRDEDRTTIMLRNIPKDTTREKLMELLNSLGFAKMYDFLYLPRDFKDNFAIYGYAFVNFSDHAQASKARELFDGFINWQSSEDSIPPCEAHWGHPLQGYAAHVERYRNSPVMSSQVPEMCRPLVFRDGLPVSFPAPTKPIRLPRRKGWILAGRRPDQPRDP